MDDIGQAIEGTGQQQESKMKSFFTDPRNLATMLVLGAALSQPRGRDQTALAHTLKSGVGALGFRGGLDQVMQDRQQTAGKQEADIGFQENQIRIRDEDQDIEVQRNAQQVQQSELDRRSREKIAAMPGRTAQNPIEDRVAGIASKMYSDAMTQHASMVAMYGPEAAGPAPMFEEYLASTIKMYETLGVQGLPQVTFVPLPEPGETTPEVEVVEEPTSQPVPLPPGVRDDKIVAFGSSGSERAHLTGAAPAAAQLKGKTPEERTALRAQRESEAEALMASTDERAIQAFIGQNSALVSKRTLAKLNRQLRKLAFQGQSTTQTGSKL